MNEREVQPGFGAGYLPIQFTMNNEDDNAAKSGRRYDHIDVDIILERRHTNNDGNTKAEGGYGSDDMDTMSSFQNTDVERLRDQRRGKAGVDLSSMYQPYSDFINKSCNKKSDSSHGSTKSGKRFSNINITTMPCQRQSEACTNGEQRFPVRTFDAMPETPPKKHGKDHWRRWFVLAGCFLTIYLFCLVLFGQGVMYLLLLERFKEGEARTSLVGSVYSAVFCFSGVLASALINIFSCRVVCLTGSLLGVLGLVLSAFVPTLDWSIFTIGVLAGLGHSFSNGGCICAIGFYFRKDRDTFLSLCFVVVGFAMMTATPLLLYMADHNSFEELCFILAAVVLHSCIFGVITKPPRSEMESARRPYTKSKHSLSILYVLLRIKSYFDISLLCNIAYVLFLLTLTTWNFALMVVTVHLPNYMSLQGGSYGDIGSIMVAFALANSLGRMTGSVVVNRRGKFMLPVQCVGLALSGIITALFPYYAHFTGGAFVFSVQLGFFLGVPNTMMTPLSNSFVDLTQIAESYGFTYIFCGFGMALGPISAGTLYTQTSTYASSFVLSGILLLIGSILGLISFKLKRPIKKQEKCFEFKTEELKQLKTIVDSETIGETKGDNSESQIPEYSLLLNE